MIESVNIGSGRLPSRLLHLVDEDQTSRAVSRSVRPLRSDYYASAVFVNGRQLPLRTAYVAPLWEVMSERSALVKIRIYANDTVTLFDYQARLSETPAPSPIPSRSVYIPSRVLSPTRLMSLHRANDPISINRASCLRIRCCDLKAEEELVGPGQVLLRPYGIGLYEDPRWVPPTIPPNYCLNLFCADSPTDSSLVALELAMIVTGYLPVAMSPPFANTTRGYWAEVPNSAAAVKLRPTTQSALRRHLILSMARSPAR